MPATHQRQILGYLGLVDTMFDELGIGEVIDQAIAREQTSSRSPLGKLAKPWCSMVWAS
jgi:hypothetical protein